LNTVFIYRVYFTWWEKQIQRPKRRFV
jgi:hypothetical protein